MNPTEFLRLAGRSAALASLAALAACGTPQRADTGSRERNCLARAMYFESNRSSDEGMLAVGTVVMNRVHSGIYPASVCGVVGQKNQFAPGVLSKPMKEGQSRARAERTANAVLSGKRHRGVGNAMFFHTAGYNFPYNNMHYKVIAGGNAFYEKRTAKAGQRNTRQVEVAGASPRARPRRDSPRIELAQAPRRAAPAERWAASPPRQEPSRAIAFVPEEAPASIEDLILSGAN